MEVDKEVAAGEAKSIWVLCQADLDSRPGSSHSCQVTEASASWSLQ